MCVCTAFRNEWIVYFEWCPGLHQRIVVLLSENLTEDYFVNKAQCIESLQKKCLLKDKATVLDPTVTAMFSKH